jgi:ectoine hydroxylase-related dioxygenase (phytanoyl-CoA dioxygenase family)
MNVQPTIDTIEEQGYAIIEGALPQRVVDQTKVELEPYLQKQKMGRNDFEGFCSERVYALLAKAPSVAEIVEHPIALAIIDAFLPKNYLLSSALAIKVHPGETPQNFHRDDVGGAFLPLPRPLLGMSTIWAYDDFTDANGATEVVPGSHRWEQGREPSPDEAVKVVMPAGSVMVFSGNLYHRGGANNSDGTRLGITPQYCAPWIRQLETMTLAVPPDVAGRYSERVQELVGYSINDPGFMGYVDGQHPKRLINSDYKGRKYRDDLPAS